MQSCENVRQEKNQTMKKQSAEMLELEAGAVLLFRMLLSQTSFSIFLTQKKETLRNLAHAVFSKATVGEEALKDSVVFSCI